MPQQPRRRSIIPGRILVLVALLGGTLQGLPARAGEDAAAERDVVATGSGPLETRIVVERLLLEERPDGGTVRQYAEAGRLEAGEQLYYTVRVLNPGREPVADVVVTKRLPYGVDYVPGSAAGPACKVEFSSDGGANFAPSAGKGAYTHVRWTFAHPLAPGATALLRFRAVFR